MEGGKTRRRFVRDGVLLGTAGLLAARMSPARAMAQRVSRFGFEEYRQYDALGLARLVDRGDVSPEQLLDIALARTEEINSVVNAVVLPHYELARDAVQKTLPAGPFRGVPFLLKDLDIALRGTVTTHGSVFFKEALYIHDSTVVERYKRAGLVIFGKTHSPEFGNTPSSESRLFGATHNPWNLQLSAGGSSGGAAAAVAAGIVPAAHASDSGGSIRIPASACGLFGLKPTRGRVPLGPTVYEGRNGLKTQHVISRSVRDSAALLDIAQGAAEGDAYAAPRRERPYLEEVERNPGRLRIALMTEPPVPVPVSPACVAAAEDAAKLCESLGHRVEPAAPSLDVESLFGALVVSSNVMVAAKVGERERELDREVLPGELEHINEISLRAGREVSAVEYRRARDMLHHASRQLAVFMRDYDLILSPTMAMLPPTLGILSLQRPQEEFLMPATAASAFCALYNMTGQPAMSVPLYWSEDNLPVGVMFAARFGDEAALFRLAAQLEKARPWFHRVPPVPIS